MSRQGFMVYHEDAKMLSFADDASIAKIFRALTSLSSGIDESGDIPLIDMEDGMIKALYDSMSSKIIRDSGRYAEKSRVNAITAKTAAIMRDAKSKGQTISKAQAERIATELYDSGNRTANANQMPANAGRSSANAGRSSANAGRSSANCNRNSNRNPNETATESLSVTQTPSVTQPGTKRATDPSRNETIDQINKAVEEITRGNNNPRVVNILKAAAKVNTLENLLKMVQSDQQFRTKLFIAAGDES